MDDTTRVTVSYTGTPWRVDIDDGTHEWHGDEPRSVGGADTAPTPQQQLCGALGTCTAITVQMYASRKQWPLTGIAVTVTMNPKGKPADGATELERSIKLSGALDEEQRARLLDIANKCPTHKILTGTIRIESSLG